MGDGRWDCTIPDCQKPGEERYDRYGIYAGRTCDEHIPWCAREDSDYEFDPAYAGESLEEDW